MNDILARVKTDGKIRLRDIDKGNTCSSSTGSWWNSGPSRRALEQLFMQGDLMVCERNGMEKVYDLAERCLPQDIDLSSPTLNEYARYLFNTTIKAHGVFTWKQLLHLKVGKNLREAMREILDEQIDAGLVKAFHHAAGQTMYVDIAALEQVPIIQADVKILSPFDNLVIHRDRLSTLFEFDYRIECYVAASKRVFGYFCLPILYNDKLVGRIDCKAYRTEKKLEILNFHLEDDVLNRDQFFSLLSQELQRFAKFNKCSILDESALDIIYRSV